MKTIIFGKGFLGTRISEELGYRLVGQEEIDPSGFSSLEKFIEREKPDVVINAVVKIGYPNSDWCEDNHGVTLESNVLVPHNLLRVCEDREIYFVHMSSGCIYNGDNNGEGFKESDRPNNYGKLFHLDTKIITERMMEDSKSLILRLKMPLDTIPHERNLITKLEKYSKVIDEQNSMTIVSDLIKTMKHLIDRRKVGTYNVFNSGTISASDIMNLYKEIVDPNHSFETIILDELNTIAKRSNSYMNTDKLKSEGIILPEIHGAVRTCLLEYKNSMVGEEK